MSYAAGEDMLLHQRRNKYLYFFFCFFVEALLCDVFFKS